MSNIIRWVRVLSRSKCKQYLVSDMGRTCPKRVFENALGILFGYTAATKLCLHY